MEKGLEVREFHAYTIIKLIEPTEIRICLTEKESYDVIDEYIKEGVDPDFILIFLPGTGFSAKTLFINESIGD